MADAGLGMLGPPLAIFSGAIRLSTPFLFVSLGECITEKSGRINLGLEGTLIMGAMTAYGVSGHVDYHWFRRHFGPPRSPHGWACWPPAVVGLVLGFIHAMLLPAAAGE